jgi:hypothetical protein
MGNERKRKNYRPLNMNSTPFEEWLSIFMSSWQSLTNARITRQKEREGNGVSP